MALELIYTSVPRGLEPGRTGFCTVAMTRGMSPQMVKILEGLVAYTPVFEHYDPNSAYNPASIFHYPVSDGRKRYELLARVCACGLDYTKRSNKIGHFILLSEAEKASAANGPTSLLADPQLFISEWHGEPQYFATERPLNIQETAPAKAYAWEQAAGDAGWAAWLAESYMANPDKPCFVVFDPLQHTNLQALVAESLMLLPRKKRWSVTWNTYMTAISAGLPTCNWRFCTANPAVMSAIGCVSGANILDLRQSLGSAGESPLRQCARMGSDPYPETTARTVSTPAIPTVPTSSASSEGSSLVAMMQKRLEEQKKAEELAELSKNKPKLRLKNLDGADQQSVSSGNQDINGGDPNQGFAPQVNGGYPANGNYPSNNGYPANGNYPANNGYPANGNYPSNNGYPANGVEVKSNRSMFVVFGGIIAVLLLIIAGLGFYIIKDKKKEEPIVEQKMNQPKQTQTPTKTKETSNEDFGGLTKPSPESEEKPGEVPAEAPTNPTLSLQGKENTEDSESGSQVGQIPEPNKPLGNLAPPTSSLSQYNENQGGQMDPSQERQQADVTNINPRERRDFLENERTRINTDQKELSVKFDRLMMELLAVQKEINKEPKEQRKNDPRYKETFDYVSELRDNKLIPFQEDLTVLDNNINPREGADRITLDNYTVFEEKIKDWNQKLCNIKRDLLATLQKACKQEVFSQPNDSKDEGKTMFNLNKKGLNLNNTKNVLQDLIKHLKGPEKSE